MALQEEGQELEANAESIVEVKLQRIDTHSGIWDWAIKFRVDGPGNQWVSWLSSLEQVSKTAN